MGQWINSQFNIVSCVLRRYNKQLKMSKQISREKTIGDLIDKAVDNTLANKGFMQLEVKTRNSENIRKQNIKLILILFSEIIGKISTNTGTFGWANQPNNAFSGLDKKANNFSSSWANNTSNNQWKQVSCINILIVL